MEAHSLSPGETGERIADMHVHTNHSCDSAHTLEDYCQRAISGGISVLCFTDHVDYNPHDDGYGYYNAAAFFEDIQSAQEKYGDKIKILAGMEFSEPHIYRKSIEKLQKLPYDFIIASIHFWKDDLFPSEMIKKEIPADICYESYWSEIQKAVSYGGFDCVGHFDFPKRYYRQLLYDKDVITGIFQIMVQKNLILEVNTSSLRKGISSMMPDRELLSIYRQCGGRFAAIGSDAHSITDLGANSKEAKALLKSEELKEVYFEKRKLIEL